MARERAGARGRTWRPGGRRTTPTSSVSFEQPSLFNKLTARENLRTFAALYPGTTRDPDELLARLGLAEAADRRVGEFSKGMRVRLDLARALQHRPRVLFLDEPTSGLDPVWAEAVRALVREEAERGAAVLLTTHDMVTADAIADRVALLVRGRVVAVDTPRALKLREEQRRIRVEHVVDGHIRVREFPLDGAGHDPVFLTLLRTGEVETLHTTEPTLADVFVRLTGEPLP